MTTNIIATIDEALEDWSVSGDAMRWAPDSARVKPSARGPNLRLGSLDLTAVTFQVDIQPFVQAMEQLAETLRRIEPVTVAEVQRLAKALTPPRPPHQPAPLCIDGHEYRRRQRGRKGRR